MARYGAFAGGLSTALIFTGCSLNAKLPEGRIRCEQSSDCPADWSCRKAASDAPGLCYRSAVDAGLTSDAGSDAATDGASNDAASGVPDASMGAADGSSGLSDGSAGDAGEMPGNDASVAMVDAGGGASDAGLDAAASVDAGPNSPPMATAVVLGKRRVTQGASVSATCLGSDPDGDPLAFTWSASAGAFMDAHQKSTNYTANTLGEQQISCSISDGRGGMVSTSATLRVYPQGLVALLPFSLDATDQSGHGNDGTVNGGAFGIDRAGNTGAAMQLDGSGANVTLKNPGSFSLASVSFVANIRPEAASHGRVIVSKGTSGFGSFTLLMYADSDPSVPGRLAMAQDSSGGPYSVVLGTYKPTLNSYIQLAVTRSDVGELRAYVDGVMIYSASGVPPAQVNGDPVVIGSGPSGGFAGTIDEVQIYDSALTAAQVQALVPLQ